MTIKLKNKLHPELLSLGLKSGDIISKATLGRGTSGVAHFEVSKSVTVQCSVWPDNYDIVYN